MPLKANAWNLDPVNLGDLKSSFNFKAIANDKLVLLLTWWENTDFNYMIRQLHKLKLQKNTHHALTAESIETFINYHYYGVKNQLSIF